jgi:PKD domain/Right handed beta helix region
VRKRCVAAGAALIISAGSLVALATTAQAATTASILYVNSESYDTSSEPCSDTTTDSSVAPYCTIQAAADVVQPGQTVQITPGHYPGGVTVTRSGTASEPIKFVGSPGDSRSGLFASTVNIGSGTPTAGYGLEISGASNVEFSNVQVEGEAAGAVYVTGSSDVELDRDLIDPVRTAGVEIGGDSTAVTIADDQVVEATGPAIQVDAGVSGTTITNDIDNLSTEGVAIDGAADTAVTGDTFEDVDGPGVNVSGGATATIENDIVESAATTGIGIETDAASASGTSADYNIVDLTKSTQDYSWAGTTYASAAALDAATGQGAHDLNTNPKILTSGTFAPLEGSPAINSGDASAPGEPATDYAGNARALDPNDPVTGTGGGYYDRGAVQIVDPIKVGLGVSNGWAAGSVAETFTAALTGAPWSPDVTYSYDFGDGTTQSSSSTTIEHTYTKPGSYTAVVTAVDADHGSSTAQTELHLAGGNAYYPLTPARVLDTRHGIGTATARVPADGTISVKLAGIDGVPATGVAAVVLNVTVAGPSANGVITVYPDGTAVPIASNLNFLHGENRPNLVTVQVGADGKVALHNSSTGTADLVADVEGYYAPGAGASYAGVENYRSDEVTLTVGKTTEASVDAQSGYSWLYTGAAAVAINVTVTAGTSSGYVTAFPSGGTVPATSNVNYSAKESIANMAIVPLGSDGGIDLVAGGAAGATVKAIIDVEGFYTQVPDVAEDGDGFVPVQPTRLIDTRHAIGVTSVGPTSSLDVDPQTLKGMPAGSAGMAANITVVDPSGPGLLNAYDFYELTTTSTLNFGKGQNVANMALFQWAPGFTDQDLYMATSGPTAGMVVDMFGYFVE